MIVRPLRSAIAPVLTRNTRLASLPLIDSRSAPGPVIVVVATSVSSSWPAVNVIFCGVENIIGSKVMVSAPTSEFACSTAHRRLPLLPSSSALVTDSADNRMRSSSAMMLGRCDD